MNQEVQSSIIYIKTLGATISERIVLSCNREWNKRFT
jgi:hypothetical protein